MRKKRLLVTGVSSVAAIAAAAGIAAAVWSASGTGTGSGAAALAKGLTVIASTPTGANASLYPGGPAGPVQFYVNNPNPYPVTVTGLQWGTPSSGDTSSCSNSNITLDTNAPTTASLSVAANAASGPFTVNGVLDLAHSAGDGCQGVTFNIPVTVTGTQQ
jgi:hypothetical protein